MFNRKGTGHPFSFDNSEKDEVSPIFRTLSQIRINHQIGQEFAKGEKGQE